MIDKIFSAAKSELTQQLGSKFQLDASQTDKVFVTAKDSLQAGIMKEVTSGNVDGLLGMLNGKVSMQGNPIVSSLAKQLIGSLTSKVGLNQQMASSVGNFIVPFIMGKLADKKPSGGFDVAGLTTLLGGEGGSLIDKAKSTLGKVFG
jgi:hypothetical protein